jgi:DNA-binding NarL/FixJ family response regulator
MTQDNGTNGAFRLQFTILIVSDQPVVRYGLRHLLSKEPNLKVCGEAENAALALGSVETDRPDLAIIGWPFEKKSSRAIIAQLKGKHPSLRTLVAIRHDDSVLMGRILRAGADGCIHYGESLATVTEAVHTVLRGEVYVSGRAAGRLMKCAIRGESLDHGVESLTDREWRIFAMIGQGFTTRQIANELDLSVRTVESHRKKIKLKLRVQNATQLSRIAYQSWEEQING